MKQRMIKWLMITIGAVLLQGCVSIPPLIQVQHKDGNEAIMQRLDSIDRRLDHLEEKSEKK